MNVPRETLKGSPSERHQMPSSRVALWWHTIRPATLWAGAAPVCVGAGISTQIGITWSFETFMIFTVSVLGSLLIQIGCNLVNDFSDFEKGTDDDHRLGPARAAAQGWLSAMELKRAAILCLALAGVCGIYLTWIGGWPILALGLASLLCAVAYTAGPFPLAYLGLGDLFVLLFFGLGAVVGTTWLLCASLTPPEAWWSGGAVGALATAILVVNNLRDREGDQRHDKRTLAVRFGARFARLEYTVLVGSALLISLGLALTTGDWGWGTPLLITPLAVQRIRQVWRTDGAALNPLLGATAQLELLFCLCLTLGLCLERWMG